MAAPMKKLTVLVPSEHAEWLQAFAAKYETSVSSVMREMVRDYVGDVPTPVVAVSVSKWSRWIPWKAPAGK